MVSQNPADLEPSNQTLNGVYYLHLVEAIEFKNFENPLHNKHFTNIFWFIVY